MNILANASINKKNNIAVKIIVGAVCLVVSISILNIFSSPIRNSFYLMSSPIEKSFFAAGESFSTKFWPFFKAGDLAKENGDLKNENQKLLSQLSLLQAITTGNQSLSAVSASCQNSNFKLLMAGVVGLDEQDILSINKGSEDGIAVGMPVISQQNVLFGKVFKVYKNFSEVMLISNKNSVIDVKVQQADPPSGEAGTTLPAINGVIRGKNGLSIYLDDVSVDSQIKDGDVLTTSALEGTFPKDILVGRISKIDKNDQKPFQQAQVDPFFNVKNTDNLFVITNYKEGK